MKILHVLNAPRAEGTPRLVLDWLTVTQYEQEVLFLSPEGELREQFEAAGVPVFYNTEFKLSLSNAFKIISLTRETCKRREPTVVISWPLGFSHWITIGARRAGVRAVLAHAGNPAFGNFLLKYVHTWICFGLGRLYGNKVVACSSYVRESYLRIPLIAGKHIEAVYNCINLRRFQLQNEAEKKDRFVMVATLEIHKDHLTLLRAWQIVESKLPNHELFIVGNGQLRESLEKEAKARNLNRAYFMGSRNDVPEILSASRFFVFSTTEGEGFGTVLIEALASGCQIISSDVSACREVLENGKYGLLVQPHNEQDLANAMISASEMKNNRTAVKEGVEYASTFSAENMIVQYLQIANRM